MRRTRRWGGASACGLALWVALVPTGALGAPKGAPEVALHGPRTRAPHEPFPTTLRVQEAYARTWDAVVAVLASRGFPLEVVARDSGVVGTGWRITQPNHEVRIGDERFVGRKAERLTVLVRPLTDGTQVSITGQSALVSPQWSAAGVPPPGQAVDIPSDTVTEYGLLYDIAGVLGLALARAPDPGYGLALAHTGIFESPPATRKARTSEAPPASAPPVVDPNDTRLISTPPPPPPPPVSGEAPQ